uniref:Uncharacterized protein n=1 Tax=Anguilla anguilla TaxID=7936 RepID=A0A0E9PAG9_ANGAN
MAVVTSPYPSTSEESVHQSQMPLFHLLLPGDWLCNATAHDRNDWTPETNGTYDFVRFGIHFK